MSGDLVSRARLLRAAVERFLAARESRERKLTVTDVARRYSMGRGLGAEEGLRVHSELFGDPDWILEREMVEVPFPLAWRFRFGWLYGVADLLRFSRGRPVAVIEVKSYESVRRGERVQASLYALLAMLNFHSRSQAYVLAAGRLIEIEEWEELAITSLSGIGHSS